ncbi:MAG: hypothetical protein R3F42_06315 [Pseudomonadota bacterium]
MKYVVTLCVLLALTAGLLFVERTGQHSDAPITGLPWQIERLADGSTRVFGITPGTTSLGEAARRLGDDMELAIIAAPGERGSLEAFYRYYTVGPITGSLILVLDVDAAVLAGLRGRAQQDAGTRRYLLHPDDLPVARAAPVRVITFMPSLDLDADIARARFGEPAEVVMLDEQQHWLYPDIGLDLLLSARGRDLLQYLSPRAFDAHRERVRQSATAAAGGG